MADSANPRETIRLSLELRGEEVDVWTYRNTLRDLISILQEVETNVTGKQSRVTWEWDDEPIVRVMAISNGVPEIDLERIVAEVRSGFERLREAEGRRVAWPPSFGPKAKKAATQIVRQLDDLDSITVETDDSPPVTIEQVSFIHDVGRKPGWQEVASVDGMLDLISLRGRPYFSIQEHATDRHIRCDFPDDMLPQVKEALGKRVVVEGRLRFNARGTPIKLAQITSLWVRPAERPIGELVGVLPGFTGGVPAGEYVRRMRSGDDDE